MQWDWGNSHQNRNPCTNQIQQPKFIKRNKSHQNQTNSSIPEFHKLGKMQTLEIKIEGNELTSVIPLKPRSTSEAKGRRV